MSTMTPSPPPRRPERTARPPEDDGFRIVPTAVSYPSPVSAIPVAPVHRAAAPPVVVRTTRSDSQALLLAVITGVILIFAVVFFAVFQLVTTQPNPAPATLSPAQTLLAAATAIAADNRAAAGPGCAALLQNPPAEADYQPTLAEVYTACGLYLVRPENADVTTALEFFRRADRLKPNDRELAHQLELANRYHTAILTILKPDLGGYIDQLEWFRDQPEFAALPYADTARLLYNAYLDSGNGYLQAHVCDMARHRFTQATDLKQIDTTDARRLLDLTLRTCK